MCKSCEALMINGVLCHEISCPENSKKTYDCFYCGAEIMNDEHCNCQEDICE